MTIDAHPERIALLNLGPFLLATTTTYGERMLDWIQWGNVAEWFGAVGTVTAVGLGAWQFNFQYKREVKRLKAEEENRLLNEVGHVTTSRVSAHLGGKNQGRSNWRVDPEDGQRWIFVGPYVLRSAVKDRRSSSIHNVEGSFAPLADLLRLDQDWSDERAISQFYSGARSDVVNSGHEDVVFVLAELPLDPEVVLATTNGFDEGRSTPMSMSSSGSSTWI